MRDLNTVFCHQHSHSQPRYPHFTLCPYCREEAPHEAIVVEAVVNYFSPKLRNFFIETELEIQMGTAKRRADIALVDGKHNRAAIVECKRVGLRDNGIDQLKSYLCATATPLGVFANSTEPDDWELYENLGQNRFKDITSNLFWKCIQYPSEEKITQPSVDAKTYYNRGIARFKLEQYDDAIDDYDMAIRLKPDYAEAYYKRGGTKHYLGQHATAILDYDAAIRIQSDFSIAYKSRGDAKAALEQYAAAIVDYDNAIRLKPDYHNSAYAERANAKYNLGQYTAAIVDYDNAIQSISDYFDSDKVIVSIHKVDTYVSRGNAKCRLGQHAAAIVDYDNAIRVDPDTVLAHNNQGEAKYNLGQYTAAIADYDKVIQLIPYTLHATACYFQNGKYYFGRHIKALAYIGRGNAKCRLGQHAAAIIDYDSAIQLKPDYDKAIDRRGPRYWRPVIEVNADYAKAYYNQGKAKVVLGQWDAAIADYDKAIQLKSDYVDAYYNRGKVKVKQRHFAAAVTDYDTAIQFKPDYAEAYYHRGEAKVKLRQYTAAIADYNTAIRLRRNYAEAYEGRGLAKQLMGKHFAAITDFYRGHRADKKR